MKCPACGNTLLEAAFGEVLLDVCAGGCGGIWFDKDELDRFDGSNDQQIESIFKIERGPSKAFDLEAVRNCPRCPEQTLWRRYYDPQNSVVVDQCPNCSGIWLDVGELEQIRAQFGTEKEKRQFGDSYLDEALQKTLKGFAAPETSSAEPSDLREGVKGFFEAFKHLWKS